MKQLANLCIWKGHIFVDKYQEFQHLDVTSRASLCNVLSLNNSKNTASRGKELIQRTAVLWSFWKVRESHVNIGEPKYSDHFVYGKTIAIP